MQIILEKLQKVLDEGTSLVESIKKQKEDIENSHNLLMDKHEELSVKEKDISQRESDLIPIENIHVERKKISDDQLKLKELSEVLDSEKKAFDSYKTMETEKLNNLRINVHKESDNLQKGFKDLKEKEKNIEAEIDKRVKEFVSKHVGR